MNIVLLAEAFHLALASSLDVSIALSGLIEAQVLAIAEHEHLPEIASTPLLNTFREGRARQWRKSETDRR